MEHNYAVIMAGGIGSRFWPISKTSHPKQFLDILGTGKTLIQQTFERFEKICPKENIYIVTNESYRALVKEQLPNISDDQILGEPAAKNTAPCIAYACHKINQKNPDALIAVAPSDHIILNEQEFVKQIETALVTAAENDFLINVPATELFCCFKERYAASFTNSSNNARCISSSLRSSSSKMARCNRRRSLSMLSLVLNPTPMLQSSAITSCRVNSAIHEA